jgi:hypothetical protein
MLALFLLAALQAAPAPPVAADKPIDVTASLIAYRDWRLCLDGVLGPPPRARMPKPKAVEAAFEACRSHEDSLRKAVVDAFGPEEGGQAFDRFRRGTRTELGVPPEPR